MLDCSSIFLPYRTRENLGPKVCKSTVLQYSAKSNRNADFLHDDERTMEADTSCSEILQASTRWAIYLASLR